MSNVHDGPPTPEETDRSPYTEEGKKRNGADWKNMVAGASAGLVSRTLTAPLDRVKVKAQVVGPIPILGTLKAMVAEDGILGLWRGNMVNLMKVTPAVALRFTLYHRVKELMVQPQKQLVWRQRFLAGLIATGLSQTLVYPLDVVKTHLVLREQRPEGGLSRFLRRLYKEYGFRFFFRGYVANVTGIVLSSGFNLSCYDTIKTRYLGILARNSVEVQVYEVMTISVLVSLLGQIIFYPCYMVGTVIQADRKQVSLNAGGKLPTSQLSAAWKVVEDRSKKYGPIRGMYRGLWPSVVKAVPTLAVSFTVFELVATTLGSQL